MDTIRGKVEWADLSSCSKPLRNGNNEENWSRCDSVSKTISKDLNNNFNDRKNLSKTGDPSWRRRALGDISNSKTPGEHSRKNPFKGDGRKSGALPLRQPFGSIHIEPTLQPKSFKHLTMAAASIDNAIDDLDDDFEFDTCDRRCLSPSLEIEADFDLDAALGLDKPKNRPLSTFHCDRANYDSDTDIHNIGTSFDELESFSPVMGGYNADELGGPEIEIETGYDELLSI